MSDNSSSATFTKNNNSTRDQTPKETLKIAKALSLEEIKADVYRNTEKLWYPEGSRGAFGGQIVGQALKAAWNTVPEGFHVHSLHNYYLFPGQADIPAIYQVNRVRDGRSFVTRLVTCTQQGKAIILCICSFTPLNNIGEKSLNHQMPMQKNIPKPEELPTNKERIAMLAADPKVPKRDRIHLSIYLKGAAPTDFRDVHVDTPEDLTIGRTNATQHQGQWFKAQERLPDNDLVLHACTIAYGADRGIIRGVLRENGVVGFSGISMIASLDYSVWFHTPTRADEWLYYDIHSPKSNDGRGTTLGYVYNQKGDLVATCAQEGIIRLIGSQQQVPRKPKATKL